MYKIFKNKIVQDRNLSPKYPRSVEFVKASQLVGMKLMSFSSQFEIFVGSVIWNSNQKQTYLSGQA